MTDHLGMLERALNQTEEHNLLFDLSWDETAKYITEREHIDGVAALINRHPDRFLFGTDEVAPTKQADYLKVYRLYQPLLKRLTPAARSAFLKDNYERVFDRARRNVRAWEAAHVHKAHHEPNEPTPISGDREIW